MVVSRGHWVGLLALGFTSASWFGCSSGEAPSDSNATSASVSEQPANQVAKTASPPYERHAQPEEQVSQFLTALKSGDQRRATAMLTVKAQEEMARTDAAIQPPGSSSAEFQVTEVEYIGEQRQGAHVLSVWTDTETTGEQVSHEIVWILRHESQGWAIAGFATQVFEDQPPLILNFEDPQDIQRKRSAVDAEIARRNSPAAPAQATLR
jgi:hypothetical protein